MIEATAKGIDMKEERDEVKVPKPKCRSINEPCSRALLIDPPAVRVFWVSLGRFPRLCREEISLPILACSQPIQRRVEVGVLAIFEDRQKLEQWRSQQTKPLKSCHTPDGLNNCMYEYEQLAL